MARIVELRAPVESVEALVPRVEELAGEPEEHLVLTDTAFVSAAGMHAERLRIRRYGDGTGEVLRRRSIDALPSEFQLLEGIPLEHPEELEEALLRTMTCLGSVVRERTVYARGEARIHLDRVQGASDLVEVIVPIAPAGDPARSREEARELLGELGLDPDASVTEPGPAEHELDEPRAPFERDVFRFHAPDLQAKLRGAYELFGVPFTAEEGGALVVEEEALQVLIEELQCAVRTWRLGVWTVRQTNEAFVERAAELLTERAPEYQLETHNGELWLALPDDEALEEELEDLLEAGR